MPELQSSSVAVDGAFADLASIDGSVLQSSLAVLGETFSAMRVDAPAEVAASLEVLDRAYREVTQALANVDFDGKLAINDATAIDAIQNLKRSENLRASRVLERFVDLRCKRTYEAPVPPQFGGGSTLPTPILNPEDLEDYPFVVDDEESALAAYGLLLVANLEVSLNYTQAACVGRVVTDLGQSVTRPDDASLVSFVGIALAACAPPSTTTSTSGPITGD
jgi:hypothetical protein